VTGYDPSSLIINWLTYFVQVTYKHLLITIWTVFGENKEVCYHFQLKFQCCIEAALLPETMVEKKYYIMSEYVCVCIYIYTHTHRHIYIYVLYTRAIRKLTSGELLTNQAMRKTSLNSKSTVMYRPIAKQRLRKHIPEEVHVLNSRTTIARQWISKQAFQTLERLCFLYDPCRGVIKGQRMLFERVVVENWV
jgi:hypothetical protein